MSTSIGRVHLVHEARRRPAPLRAYRGAEHSGADVESGGLLAVQKKAGAVVDDATVPSGSGRTGLEALRERHEHRGSWH